VKFSFYKPNQPSAATGVPARLSVPERCRLLELREKVLEHRSYEVNAAFVQGFGRFGVQGCLCRSWCSFSARL
jgi:hypothetical protein